MSTDATTTAAEIHEMLYPNDPPIRRRQFVTEVVGQPRGYITLSNAQARRLLALARKGAR